VLLLLLVHRGSATALTPDSDTSISMFATENIRDRP